MSALTDVCPAIAAPLGAAETDRLILRRFAADDLEALATVFAKPEVWRFPYGGGFSRDQTSAFLDRQIAHWDELGFGLWLAIDKAGGAVIGFVGLSVPLFLPEALPAVEVGWRFDPEVWGRGLATEGAAKALDEGFATLGLTEICSIPQAENPPSSRVCDRLGMRLERVVEIPANDIRGALAANFYTITPAEWGKRKA